MDVPPPLDPAAYRRASLVAVVVGTALVLINHGDHLCREPVCHHFFLKAGLSYAVPFLVSLYSTARATRGEG
ncbi:MAG: nitrate/nitrite transporter NrtS [Kofleriaceae bacterium]|nr:nitrate/nitrite transporter NrtS [Myxococcales bacterium]MCB9559776.1 nitrate/nitrite transporter NrtS [Kofleriaceae bacterium]